ncbi:FMN-dependent NADH-azoreductase 2 [Companilactobacillus sp. RD055328]|uniref:FMN-dependent NADH-azoreductase n=1 Tax=Companilactobacillus sp. RD055328 TaxID=2916634 RepID=UPI001FC84BD2|nr:NAD(P)H-dependent oxidoreductase [Companilactobacillus sp. RD055328]GKQ42617.1 FMN-dependent NADH-azoreductase 2 [Companilactobacillus sp. RD055328]
MAKVLIIRAHPASSKKSNSMDMADKFKEVYKQEHPNDEVIEYNLSSGNAYPLNDTAISIYNKSLAKESLNITEKEFREGRQKYVDEFVSADKYVFANPMYNLFIPAEMKTYFDIVMQIPDTFHYTKDGKPEGLLKNKKALHIQTDGGIYHGEPDMSFLDLGDQYIRSVLGIMGVSDVESIFAEGMDYAPDKADAIMEKAMSRIEECAKNF